MEKSKRAILQITICIGLLCIIWGTYFLVMRRLDKRIAVVENDFTWMFQVDSAEINGEEFVIKGFAFDVNQNSSGDKFKVVLRELESQRNYFLEMEYTERADVNAYFSEGYNYLMSGFEATIENDKLDFQEKDYEVLLRMEKAEKAYQTGVYLANGALSYVNPAEFEPLEVAGTDLQEVVENGIIRVYRPNDGIYVYQYEGELYWIAEPEYAFNEDGDVYVQYRVETTQPDKLPEERLAERLDWDDCGFMFCNYELVNWNTGKYRVASKKIPMTYPIKMICSGRYNGDWQWIQYFRPYYQFGSMIEQ